MEMDLRCECESNEEGRAVEYRTYENDSDITGWYEEIATFTELECWREDGTERKINATARKPPAGEVDPGDVIRALVRHYVEGCGNEMGVENIKWHCKRVSQTAALDEPSDGLAYPETTLRDGAPDHGWKIDPPTSGPAGTSTHHFTLFNNETPETGGDTLYISSIKFHVAMVRYNHPATEIDWINLTNVLVAPPLILTPGGTYPYDVVSTGSNFKKYVYVQFDGTHSDGSALFVCTGRHSAFNTLIPAVGEWGLAVMALLVIAAATVVLRRRRASFA